MIGAGEQVSTLIAKKSTCRFPVHFNLLSRVGIEHLSEAPEYGKATFYKRFTAEIQKIKKRCPNAVYAGVADGAADNRKFLESFISESIVDYFHVSEYPEFKQTSAVIEINLLNRVC